jgi:hypothetical protein
MIEQSTTGLLFFRGEREMHAHACVAYDVTQTGARMYSDTDETSFGRGEATLPGSRESAQVAGRGFLFFFVMGSSGGKNALQPGLNCSRCRFMQAVMRSTSGISELQSRTASLLQSCCCSGV